MHLTAFIYVSCNICFCQARCRMLASCGLWITCL